MSRFLAITYAWARRCVIALIGSTVVLIGVAMIVLPGPALVVIPAGLAILGLEFAFARRWLRKMRSTGTHIMSFTLDRFRWFRFRSSPDRRDVVMTHPTRNEARVSSTMLVGERDEQRSRLQRSRGYLAR